MSLALALGLTCALPGTTFARAADPVLPLMRRIHRYFAANEVDGVCLDSRYSYNPSEAIRMSVVCQLLGYAEAYKAHPTPLVRREIVAHADYLVPRIADISSHGPFDGMLACSLLEAFRATGDSTYLTAGRTMVEELEAIPTSQCVLNGGLMVAMATVVYHQITGDPTADEKTRAILSQEPYYQNEDGSFPHWCFGTKDIHYTGWMAMELNLIQRDIDVPIIETLLQGMAGFLDARLDSMGNPHYEAYNPASGDTVYYDSRRSGCDIDYDTRALTVEPAYCALAFDHEHLAKYDAAMKHLLSLENGGTFKDKWDFIEPVGDPQHPWSVADTSVGNMSIIFWALGAALSGRHDRIPPGVAWLGEGDDDDDVVATLGGNGPAQTTLNRVRLDPIRPNPVRRQGHVRFAANTRAPVSLAIYDVSGRRVRTLASGAMEPGEHEAAWDGRDDGGIEVTSGIYFVRLRVGAATRTSRMVFVR